MQNLVIFLSNIFILKTFEENDFKDIINSSDVCYLLTMMKS